MKRCVLRGGSQVMSVVMEELLGSVVAHSRSISPAQRDTGQLLVPFSCVEWKVLVPLGKAVPPALASMGTSWAEPVQPPRKHSAPS